MAFNNPNDILAQLPALTWRGLDAPPCDLVGFELENELAPRGVPYVDVDVHDNVRRRSIPVKARLYFCEVLSEGAFTILWPAWLQALKTGDPDTLVHPLLGTMRCRVHKVSGEVRAQTRDGVIVDVVWLETNEDPSIASADVTTEFDIKTLATLCDQNLSDLDISYPDGTFSTSLFDAISQIQGQLFSLSLTVTGAIDQTLGQIAALIDLVKLRNDHNAWPALDGLYNLWSGVYRTGQAVSAAARPTATRVAANDTTLEQFAADVGNKLKEVMGLNPRALQSPIVARGTTLRYYTTAA